jgi:hypothetical protein
MKGFSECNLCGDEVMDSFVERWTHLFYDHPEVAVERTFPLMFTSREVGEQLGDYVKEKLERMQ